MRYAGRRPAGVIALVLLVPSLLAACTTPEPEPTRPVPSSGAAWGDEVIPFSTAVKIEGRWREPTEENAFDAGSSIAPDSTVTSGDDVELVLQFTWSGSDTLTAHLVIKPSGELLNSGDVTVVDPYEQEPVSFDDPTTLLTETGYVIDGIDPGTVVETVIRTQAPKVCSESKFQPGMMVWTDDGQRRSTGFPLIVEPSAPCED